MVWYSPWNSPGQSTGVGSLSPPPWYLPNPGIKSRSPTLQVNSLLAKPQEKPKNPGVGSLSLLQQNVPTQESNRGLLHCRWILYQLNYQGSPKRKSQRVESTCVWRQDWVWLKKWPISEMETEASPSGPSEKNRPWDVGMKFKQEWIYGWGWALEWKEQCLENIWDLSGTGLSTTA